MNNPAAQPNQRAVAFFCVSLNPAIDTRLTVKGFIPGRVNRAVEVCRTPGGKAAHVAMALKGLGATPTWIGFSGGVTGSELLAGLRLLEIEMVPVSTCDASRVNLEILDSGGEVTEVLEPGGTITQSEWSEFQQVCASAFQIAVSKKIVVISGSLPPGVPTEAYAAIVSSARSANCLAFVDSSGLPLSKALAAGPDLVKINREEAESVTQVVIKDPISAAQAARKLLDMGANSAAVSLGDRGIVGMRKQDQLAIHAWTTPVQGKSTVGCGDSALAGLAFAAATDLPFDRSLALAVACGASNCLAGLPGRIVREDVSHFEEGVHMERLQV
ncbi:MAG TPA: hexose kinase [Candidatus Polarisedimenticolia bacterium]|nr:hexose kinase [Candidatus Polarisedimenticolia bacterium]